MGLWGQRVVEEVVEVGAPVVATDRREQVMEEMAARAVATLGE